MDIGGWLRSLGLGQHESAVCDSDIDAEVLNELTNGDLEKLGISLGNRKRLLEAISSLGAPEIPTKPRSRVPAPTSTECRPADRDVLRLARGARGFLHRSEERAGPIGAPKMAFFTQASHLGLYYYFDLLCSIRFLTEPRLASL